MKISEAIKKRVEQQQILPVQLPPLFKEPNFYKILNKSGHNHRMTGTKGAFDEKPDWKKTL